MRILAKTALRRIQCRLISNSRYYKYDAQDLFRDFCNEPAVKHEKPFTPVATASPVTDIAPQSHRRILILEPNEVKDRVLDKLKRDRKERLKEKKQSQEHTDTRISVLEDLGECSNSVVAIDKLKPLDGKISPFTASNLTSVLSKGFKKDQLWNYIDAKDTKKPLSSSTKAKLAAFIVTNVWQNTVDAEAPLESQVVETLAVSEKDIFYILTQNGRLQQMLRSLVPTVDLNIKKGIMTLIGTEKQVANAKINFLSQLYHACEEEADLGFIKRLLEEKFGRNTLQKVGFANNVYFKHVLDDTYLICSLKQSNLVRMKRLLLWFLDYNMHQKNNILLPSEEELSKLSLVNYFDPSSHSWIERLKVQFQLVDESKKPEISARVKDELNDFNLLDVNNLDIDDANPRAAANYHEPLSDDTFDLLKKLGILRDDFDEKRLSRENEEINGSLAALKQVEFTSASEPIILKETRNLLHAQLCDFSYRSNLPGVSERMLDEPMLTLTLGRVLFDKERDLSEVTPLNPNKENLTSSYSFNSNIPLVYDHALSNSFSVGNSDFLKDPHSNYLQFVFSPSPYLARNETPLNEQMQYPQIEMWATLNENLALDIESIQLVTVEGENNAFVCLPQFAADLKLTTQITGQLLEKVLAEPRYQASNIEKLLDAPADKFLRLSSQPGVQEFLLKLELDFKEESPKVVAPNMTVKIAGKDVEYCFMSLKHRKVLTLETIDKITVQLNSVNGGLLTGRKLEAIFTGDCSVGLDKDNFDKLLDYGIEFVRAL